MKRLTPLRAIRVKCLDCSAGQRSEIRNCPVIDCPLYLYRFGKNPKKKGQGPKTPLFLRKHKAQDAISEIKDRVLSNDTETPA